jgi:hypothetical protein
VQTRSLNQCFIIIFYLNLNPELSFSLHPVAIGLFHTIQPQIYFTFNIEKLPIWNEIVPPAVCKITEPRSNFFAKNICDVVACIL